MEEARDRAIVALKGSPNAADALERVARDAGAVQVR